MAKRKKDFLTELSSKPAPWELDLEALAIRGRKPHPTDRLTPKQRTAWSKRLHRIQRRKRKERIRLKVEATAARLRSTPAWAKHVRAGKTTGKPFTLVQRVLIAIPPGAWFGSAELRAALPDVARGSFRAILWQKLPRLGFVERGRNARYDSAKRIFSRDREPEFLYRLTPAGEKARELALILE